MEMKIVKELDELTDNGLSVNLTHKIGRFHKWFISNIFDRSLAYLVGWTGTSAKMLLCTSAGLLRVSAQANAFESYDTKSGTTANAYSANIEPDSVATKMEIWTNTNGLTIKISQDGSIFDDEIVLAANSYWSADCTIEAVQVKSTVTDNHATYQLLFWM